MENIKLQAPDISCGHCVSTVNNRLGNLEGVASVDASSDTKLIDVTFDAEKVSLEKIQAELADAGYPANPVQG
jgi:copper ion binding protein